MKKQDVDAVMVACLAWVAQHHRVALTPAEAQDVRRKLMAFLEHQIGRHVEALDLVKLAHKKATEIIDRRRDRAELARAV